MKNLLGLYALLLLTTVAALAQANSESAGTPDPNTKSSSSAPAIPLSSTSTMNLPSEMGGAFPAKCDEDGNLYIRKLAADRPLLGSVAKISPDGKRRAACAIPNYKVT